MSAYTMFEKPITGTEVARIDKDAITYAPAICHLFIYGIIKYKVSRLAAR